MAGVVPAAGSSRRMGRPKALLDAGGIPFVEAVVQVLAHGGCDPVVVVVGPDGEAVAAKAAAAGARVIVNDAPGEGPITSLRLALRALPDATGVAVLPVDHPRVRPDTVGRLLDAGDASGILVALPVFGGRRGHPTLFRRALFPRLMDPELRGGARTVVHDLLEAEDPRVRLVETDDAGVVEDLDTPEAYLRAFGSDPRAPVPGGSP